VGIIYDAAIGKFQESIRGIYTPMAKAATAAIKDTATTMRNGVKSNILGSGFTRRWANAVKVTVIPRSGASLDASAHLFMKGYNFAGIFEQGGRFGGKGLMWIPLPDIPEKIGGKRMTPALFIASTGLQLRSANVPGRPPMLVAQIAVGARGVGTKTIRKFKGAAAGADSKWIPVFIGLSAHDLDKRFNTEPILKAAVDGLEAKYIQNLARLI
jgi:hypothetical protein